MLDIPKLFTALAEWLSAGMFLLLYRKFINPEHLVLKLIVSAAFLTGIQLLCGILTGAGWLLGMAAAVSCMLWLISSCLKLSPRDGGYITCRAFLYAEFIAAFEWQIYHYYIFYGRFNKFVLSLLTAAVFYLVLLFLLYLAERSVLPSDMQRSYLQTDRKERIIAAVIALFFWGMSNLSYNVSSTPFSGTDEATIFNIRTLFDFSGALVLYVLNLQRMGNAQRQEVTSLNSVLQNQYRQYRMSQETAELINHKYHDLKNQLEVLRAETDSEKRLGYINEMEQGIRQYEAQNKTGNAVLDTILTDKSSQCLKYDIQFTAVADGSLLSGIHVMDLCTIFGNALDNAIEYEVQIPDSEKRLIHLAVGQKQGVVSVLVENYFEGKLELTDGLPVTTKNDTQYHGYGMKSIRRAVEKYGGNMQVSAQDGWFRLQIILPVLQ